MDSARDGVWLYVTRTAAGTVDGVSSDTAEAPLGSPVTLCDVPCVIDI